MRFMMLMIPLGYETAPPDVQLDPERVKAMMKYNEALKEAGVLIALDGLHPPSMGARVSFATGKPVVTDGPFTEAKEVLGGYWMIDVKSREEAIAWAKKCPASENEIIEIRQVQEMADFSEEVQQAAAGFDELQKGSATVKSRNPSTARKENLMSANDTFLAVFSAARPVRKWRPGMRCPRPSGAPRSSRESRPGRPGSRSIRRRSSPSAVRSARPRRSIRNGIADIANEMGAFTVVRAGSHEAAAKLFENHPHFAIFPGERVEIMPVLPVPGG